MIVVVVVVGVLYLFSSTGIAPSILIIVVVVVVIGLGRGVVVQGRMGLCPVVTAVGIVIASVVVGHYRAGFGAG